MRLLRPLQAKCSSLQPPPSRTIPSLVIPWVCSSCRHNAFSSSASASTIIPRRSSSTVFQKPYYITTPVFYVNASPHIGHLHSMVLGDVLKRWHLLRHPDTPVMLLTGTDEHGLKVQQAAVQAGTDAQALCDTNSQHFQHIARAANVSHNVFARTTDAKHGAAVEHFWRTLVKNGHVYRAPRAGWYSVSDECFYKDAEVERKVQPRTGTVLQVAAATGNEVTWVEEENWHFRLTAFKDRLLTFYAENDGIVQPVERQNEVVSWIRTHLSDLSISRPASRLTWGVPVPDDATQTVYVWVDALVSYIVHAGYPSSSSSSSSPWPADVHIIGKDILRFHCVYWPALLMAANLPLPRSFLTHAHWTMNRCKMSKSVGNVVDPFRQLQRWGTDAVRYFLMAEAGAMADDKEYNNNRVLVRYRELQSKFGNTINRIKTFGVDRCVTKMLVEKEVALLLDGEATVPELASKIQELPGLVSDAMEKSNIPLAVQHVLSILTECNRWCDEIKPWTRELDDHKLIRLVALMAESLRICGIIMQPIMPDKMAALLGMLGVMPKRRTWEFAKFGADETYGRQMAEPEGGVLFQAIKEL